jgi:hypothetical protein
MKTTLYEALGIPPSASDEEVRASLRRLIRKYYAKTRDGQGNVEEALRFVNHASRILGDPERRARYDRELALSDGLAEQRIAHLAGNAFIDGGEQTDVRPLTGDRAPDDLLESGLDAAEPAPERQNHHPGLTERVASFGHSTAITVGLCALFGAFIAAAILFVTPADAVFVAKQVLVWLTLTLVALTIVYGVVHGLGWARRGGNLAGPSLMPQTDLAILNWRREKSVFLGANQPEEDASWIFQLRMAELERAKAGRTSEPRPWNRLAARLFDYALWGLVLALLLSELRGAGAIADSLGYWLAHPFVAPVFITLSWVPIETLLVTSVATTPGKWLFGCYLQFCISDAYAERGTHAQLQRGIRRAFRVWWQGVGCGIPVLAPIFVAVAYERIMQHQEADWDFAQDCLVTHGQPGLLNLITGVCGLAAMLWLYGVAWHKPMADTIEQARVAILRVLPAPQSLLPRMLSGDGGRLATGLADTPAKGPDAAPVAPAAPRTSAPATSGTSASEAPKAGAASQLLDPTIDAQFAERRSRIAALKDEGQRMLRAGNFRRAAELCGAWTDLDLGNADAWRCLGRANQALGYHREAINAFRKARQFDPYDRTLDASIERSRQGIVTEFLNRYSR